MAHNLTPSPLDDLEIYEPTSPAGIMLRELVPDPDRSQFALPDCLSTNIPHHFELEEGEANPERIGSWSMRCPGPIGPLLRNEGILAGERCDPQFGEKLSGEQAVNLLAYKDRYKKQYDAVNGLVKQLKEVDYSLATLYCLGPFTPLPKEAAALISAKLEVARTTLDRMDILAVPENPEILESIDDVPRATTLEEVKWEDPGSDPDSDYRDERRDLDPIEETLEVVFPAPRNKPAARHIRVVVYSVSDQMPYHAIFCVPNEKFFRFADYPLPPPLSPVTTVRFYSVFSEKYFTVWDHIDLTGRGKFLIFIKSDVLSSHCPRLDKWEARARDFAQMEKEASLEAPSSPLPPSSPFGPSATSKARAIASSSSTTVVGSSSTSSTRELSPFPSAKRPAPEEMASSSSSKKLKTSGSPGRTYDNPFIVQSSDS
ncbi:hypothetical protein B0H11DRAFT_1926775 [Mycena galericulata]|nr:hypothetical protein B0H11DRAFT_1926775 [Mycena galericulata]